ncbi:rhodanese-like domain-containing protein [Jannaschia sp. W003]|uniref:rhodanese-like domain-containing protein n=1 Tax=Jannaschia sp. W003 TaxID=2867012 RepID=UPI0021A6F4AB|nr:rhodanese-like domain-containing protein [Jannaschia sp. W003]UWQ22606.1 rhodanese-like domain-containing protein [Jannaschia sp. W003]
MKSAEQLVAEARARVRELSVEEVRALDPERTVIVDVRDVRERAAGRIPGSVHAPRGMLEFWWDPASPYHREVFAQEGVTYVLHCAVGWRSALAADALRAMGHDVAHMWGGFEAWKAVGAPVEVPEGR